MSLITLAEAKNYLKVDITDDDALITSLMQSATTGCVSVARLTQEQWEAIDSDVQESDLFTDFTLDDARRLMKPAILFTLSYFYEHRTDGDHSALNRTLRAMLFSLRESVV